MNSFAIIIYYKYVYYIVIIIMSEKVFNVFVWELVQVRCKFNSYINPVCMCVRACVRACIREFVTIFLP